LFAGILIFGKRVRLVIFVFVECDLVRFRRKKGSQKSAKNCKKPQNVGKGLKEWRHSPLRGGRGWFNLVQFTASLLVGGSDGGFCWFHFPLAFPFIRSFLRGYLITLVDLFNRKE
jgi:hypothetical protein